MKARLSLIAAATGALALAGCNAGPLSTAASMRVEVEVYKGPLSKEPEVQWGELAATLEEAANSLAQFHQFLNARIRAVVTEKKWNPEGKISDVEQGAWQQIVGDLTQARHDVVTMQARAQGFTRWYYAENKVAIPPYVRSFAALGASLAPILSDSAALRFSARRTPYCQGAIASLSAVPSSQEEQALRERLALCHLDALAQLSELSSMPERSNPTAAGGTITTSALVGRQIEGIAILERAQNELTAIAAAERAALTQRALEGLKLAEPQRQYLIALLGDIGGLARQLHAKALFWSGSHIAFSFTGFEGVRLPASIAALLGTYADRIGPRADSLIKQVRGDDRQGMSLSVALRETSPPAFLKQYIWNRAGGSLTGDYAGKNETRDRVREIERLYTDENWTNINTVYASGQGTVRMALIKDDIGNWNLKSFDQDPSELLNAYRNVGLAGLKAATGVITAAVSGGGSAAAMQALAMANQLATGTAPGGTPTLGSSNLAELRGEVKKRLEELHAKAKTEDETLAKQIDTDEKSKPNLFWAMTDTKTAQDAKKRTLDEAAARQGTGVADNTAYEAALADWAKAKVDADAAALAHNNAKARKTALPATMLAQAREILASHEKVVDALEGAIVRNRSTASDLKDALSKTPGSLPAAPR